MRILWEEKLLANGEKGPHTKILLKMKYVLIELHRRKKENQDLRSSKDMYSDTGLT